MGGLHKAGRDFITKRTRLNLSCVLEAGFVPLEVVYFEVLFGPGRKVAETGDWRNPWGRKGGG